MSQAALHDVWRLSDTEIDRVCALVREIGRAEVKVIVRESSHDALRSVLDTDPSHARPRRVYYLDTPDLALRRHGVLARVRSGGTRPGDSVVKLRPLVPGGVPPEVRQSAAFTAEVDLTPGGFVCSGSLKASTGMFDVDRIIARGRGLGALFTRPQLALLAERVPGAISVDGLTAFGPVVMRRVRMRPDGLSRPLDVQQWDYPDGTRLLELSTRSSADDLVDVTTRTARFLEQHGIRRSKPCPTKADQTLEFFAHWQADED